MNDGIVFSCSTEPPVTKIEGMADHRPALKSLPVPDLGATLGRLHTVVSAIADAPTLATTERAIRDFATSPGPELQQTLRDFATERDAANSNWLADRWLRDYLSVRTPLQLATNVGFQINLPTASTGIDRAVEVIRIFARLHLLQSAGRMPEERDARDQPIDSAQWRCFNGALREPTEDCDTVTFCNLGPNNRRIGLLANGHMFDVPITDGVGQLASADALRAAVQTVLDRSSGDPGDVTRLSYAGSSVVASSMTELHGGQNGQIYASLRDQLFAINLLDVDGTEPDALRDIAFTPGHAWVYRPITYQVNVHVGGEIDDFLAMHVEHSTVDGATLVSAVARAQQIRDGELDATPEAGESWAGPLSVRELVWEPDGAGRSTESAEKPAAQGRNASDLRVALVHVPRVTSEDLPFKFSADAMSQLILSIAQELTYGRIRAVYEAVDMREYKAGRTECLRAVTPEAVAFAKSLVASHGTADNEPALNDLLHAAIDAHRGWVKACKKGEGIDRHLWALAFTAEKMASAGAQATPALMEDPGVIAARTDFLSTTSIGSDRQIVRYVFAPTVAQGFGVNYTPGAETIEYCLTWHATTAERPEEFQANLARAGELLARFLRGEQPRED